MIVVLCRDASVSFVFTRASGSSFYEMSDKIVLLLWINFIQRKVVVIK